jgi:hypothetical protein
MNNKEITRQKANERAADFLETNKDELNGMPLYSELKTAFDADMLNIQEATVKQAEQIIPITRNKNRLRLVMADTMVKFLLRAAVQCNNKKRFDLEKAFTKGKTYFTRGRETDAVMKAKDLVDLIVKKHSIVTVISNSDIVEMEVAIHEFDVLKPIPKMEIKQKKATTTDIIPAMLNNMDVNKEQIGMLIHSYLPHLAHTWDETIKVGHSTAIRHISLEIKVVDSVVNVPLRRIKCTISNGKDSFVKQSTRRGNIRFKSLQDYVWTVTIEHQMYQTEVRHDIITYQKKITRLTIPLIKNTVSL